MSRIKNKQIEDNTIQKNKLNLVSPTADKDPVTKGYFDNRKINGKPLITDITLDKIDIGLPNVDNTFDVDKPVSNPQQLVFNTKVTYGTLSYFSTTYTGDTNSFFVTDKGKEGEFVYDATDTTSIQDGVLVLIKSGKRYKRVHNRIFYPSWWGIDETGAEAPVGTNNVGSLLNTMFTAANAAGATVEANGIYLINEPYPNGFPFAVHVRCNLIGRGIFKTRNGATLNYLNSNITIANITIDGFDGTSNVGRGLYNDGWPGVSAFNVKIFNTTSQGFWWRNSDNCKIVNCTTRNNIGANGDGIYVAQSNNVQILGNLCTEFQRIGITCEGNDSGFDYTKNAVISNNVVRNAIPSLLESQNYPNGGIWTENIAGCIIEGNIVENTYFRGIAVTPSLASTTDRYAYIIKGNTVKNCHRIDAASGPGYGIASVYANYGDIIISDNIITDCQRFIGIGDADNVKISGNVFSVDKDLAEDVSALISIDFIRIATPTDKTTVVIEGCINTIEGLPSGRSITYPNVNNQRADLEVINCKGNFSTGIVGTQVINGNFTFINCTLDWSTINAANTTVFNITGKVLLKDCTIKLGGPLFPACTEIEFNNTKCYADAPTRWTQWLNGARIIKILNNSEFDNVSWFDIRRSNTEIYLKNSSFENYPGSQGLFVNTVTLVDRVEVDGCKFSRTNITTAPLSFAAGVTEIVQGENFFSTSALFNTTIGSANSYKQYTNFTIGIAQKPTTPKLGHLHYDNVNNKFERWNGTAWDTSTSFIINTAITAPTKTSLNATYGSLRAMSTVYYPNITTGARKYFKLSDSTTGDWDVQTLNLLT